MRCVFALLLLLCAGCDWSAADGPWNAQDDDDDELVLVRGTVCIPEDERGVPGLSLQWFDALDVSALQTQTDPFGRYAGEVVPGRYTVQAGDRLFRALSTVNVPRSDSGFDLDPLCLQGAGLDALVLRSADAAATDLMSERLRGLGLQQVHDGPTDPGQASLLLGAPAGLVDYGVVVVAGELDWTLLLTGPSALNGLEDLLARGGALVLSPLAWPLLDALAPGVLLAPPEVGVGGSVLATPSDSLAVELMWDWVSLPLPVGGPLFRAREEHTVLRANLPFADGSVGDAALLLRVPVGAGRILLSAFLAPAPRPDAWWMGDPADFVLPDGSWDGRGAVLDRLLLQL